MAQTKSWERWTQKTKTFPTNQYHLTEILKNVGDRIITDPMTEEEYERFRRAVKFWGWRRGKKVQVRTFKYDGKRIVQVTLVSHTRTNFEDYADYWNNVFPNSTKRSSKK